MIDRVRITGTVTTAADAGNPLGYTGIADLTALSGYPTGKEIIARVPMIAYSGSTTGIIFFPTSTQATISSKGVATFTFIIDILYKRG